jgi:hypothetical protein
MMGRAAAVMPAAAATTPATTGVEGFCVASTKRRRREIRVE